MKYRHSLPDIVIKAGNRISNAVDVSEQAENIIVMVPPSALGTFFVLTNGCLLIDNGLGVSVGAGCAVVLRGTLPNLSLKADTVMATDCTISAAYDSYTA